MSAAEGIAETNAEFQTAWAAGNGAGVAECYTAEGQFKVPNLPTLEGREAIGNAIQGLIDSGVSSIALTTTDVIEMGDVAIEHGEFTLYAGDDVADKGRFMVHWKNDGGTWRLHRDIINSSQPAG